MIQFYNLKTRQVEKEEVYGDFWIRWFYGKKRNSKLHQFLTGPLISKIYGFLQNTGWSRKKIAPFVKKYKIPMEVYQSGGLQAESQSNSYRNFNEFFVRKFVPGKRPFDQDLDIMPAFCEARYLGHQMNHSENVFPVKGSYLSHDQLLGDDCPYRHDFESGPILIARLCPVDYHRFHYPDSGKLLWHKRISGALDSVNPVAILSRPTVFIQNERHINILETKNFGRLAYIEIGAMCVGKIIQSHHRKAFERGEEKGYFLFGGSCVVVLGQKNRWRPISEVLEQTSLNRECLVQLGRPIAQRL